MTKKLKICRGTSIAEMLVAVVLLALLTAGGITAASAVLASYNRMKEVANADILASTVIEAFSNEIRLGRNIKVDPAGGDGTLTLDSAFFGEGAALTSQGDHLVAIPKDKSATDAKELLSADTYNGLKLTGLTFKQTDPTAGTEGRTVYTISFNVCNSSDLALWTGSADAAPMR